jgi:mono/diheme cytochrome c family protein
MKRMLWVITVLLLSLTACGGGVAEKGTPSPAGAGNPVTGEKIVGDTTVPFPTPTEIPVAGEETFETVLPSLTPAGDPVAGGKLFASACAACHGQDMTQSEFIATKTNQELVEFIKVGGVPDEPLVMPPRGGNPSLTDEKLDDIAAYLRSLQK